MEVVTDEENRVRNYTTEEVTTSRTLETIDISEKSPFSIHMIMILLQMIFMRYFLLLHSLVMIWIHLLVITYLLGIVEENL